MIIAVSFQYPRDSLTKTHQFQQRPSSVSHKRDLDPATEIDPAVSQAIPRHHIPHHFSILIPTPFRISFDSITGELRRFVMLKV